MMTQTPNYSYNFYDVQNKLCQNLNKIIASFNLDLKKAKKMYFGSCPIHCGDNDDAFNLYYQGFWKCRTRNCHGVFKTSLLGLIRGLLSKQRKRWHEPGDRVCSFGDTIDFVEKLIDTKLSIQDKALIEKNTFVNNVNLITNDVVEKKVYGSRDQIRSKLEIPADYFIKRGFSSIILNKYDVGFCPIPYKPMSDRVVVPIYDDNRQYMVGCTGRSVYKECQFCKCYHQFGNKCPDAQQKYLHAKWRHSGGFLSGEHLYNYWFAKEHLLESRTAIIVESPGNVWRLEEAGFHNSLAIFGSNFQSGQKDILDKSGVMKLIVLTDNDDAGKIAQEEIAKTCWRDYQVICPTLPDNINDIGEMSIKDTQSFVNSIGQ